jgi:hypothetical protein
VLEGKLLKLGADPMTADVAGQGRVDVARLAGDALALGLALDEVQGPHVVQTVGQLDQQDADVLGDGQDELAQVLGLTRMFGLQLQLRQLGDALDQLGDLFAKQLADLFLGDRSVLDHVVQQGRDDGGGVQPVLGQDAGHLNRVGVVGIAAGPGLRTVHAHGVDIGPVQQGLVSGRIVGVDALDQFVLAKELLARLGGGGRRRRVVGRSHRRRRARSRIGRAFGRSGGGRRFKDQRVCAVGAQYRSS